MARFTVRRERPEATAVFFYCCNLQPQQIKLVSSTIVTYYQKGLSWIARARQ